MYLFMCLLAVPHTHPHATHPLFEFCPAASQCLTHCRLVWQSLTRLFSAAAATAGDPLDPFHGIQMRLGVVWAAWASQHLFKHSLTLKLTLLAEFSSALSFTAFRPTADFAVVMHFSVLLTFDPSSHLTYTPPTPFLFLEIFLLIYSVILFLFVLPSAVHFVF